MVQTQRVKLNALSSWCSEVTLGSMWAFCSPRFGQSTWIAATRGRRRRSAAPGILTIPGVAQPGLPPSFLDTSLGVITSLTGSDALAWSSFTLCRLYDGGDREGRGRDARLVHTGESAARLPHLLRNVRVHGGHRCLPSRVSCKVSPCGASPRFGVTSISCA